MKICILHRVINETYEVVGVYPAEFEAWARQESERWLKNPDCHEDDSFASWVSVHEVCEPST